MAKQQRNSTDGLSIDVRRIVRGIEELINNEIHQAPRAAATTSSATQPVSRIGGRVMYVALPGTAKSQEALSHRAKQVLDVIRKRKATADRLQSALKVNRNVIAGAVHQLKRRSLIQVVPVPVDGLYQAAAGAPRHTSDDRPRKARKKTKTRK